MTTREPRHGAGTSEEEANAEIDQMERGESGAAMTTRESRHGAGTSQKEVDAEIDQMERGELSGWDMVVADEVGEVRGRDWSFAAARERATNAVVEAVSLVGFYPTLLANVALSKIKPGHERWHRVDKYVLLGAVPFSSDVPLLKELGVRAVVTLTRSYETLVPSSFYEAHQINHLGIPTTDFVFAPSMENIHEAVNFIQHHALEGGSTYVHCKAGRARSTTIVLCYLVKYRNMTPRSALKHVASIRRRVKLAKAQWQAVKEFSKLFTNQIDDESSDSEFVIVSDEDLDGYDDSV